ncbi:Ig-like domain-containing protein [Listeria booriae]|uniref:Bacterial Ig domain-containing protein n=1 Tax=Listeria booriae TaxID=1552123 RepID=A0A099VYT6_9LIST|nr:Ig-like domain-containing protein [Listeria booriae]KGL37932.1 hypothetical protein EP57_15350 [Listeria booriae]STY45929.1 Uncharacterised protein [Listeria booriae]
MRCKKWFTFVVKSITVTCILANATQILPDVHAEADTISTLTSHSQPKSALKSSPLKATPILKNGNFSFNSSTKNFPDWKLATVVNSQRIDNPQLVDAGSTNWYTVEPHKFDIGTSADGVSIYSWEGRENIMYQTVATTPGETYTFTYNANIELSHANYLYTGARVVDEASNTILVNNPKQGITKTAKEYSTTFTATGTSTRLEITNSCAGGGTYKDQQVRLKNATVSTTDSIPPEMPSIQAMNTVSTTISGQAEPYAFVQIFANDVFIEEVQADSQGYYSIDVSPYAEGTTIATTATDSSGNRSAKKEITITPAIVPTPTLDIVTDQSETVSGSSLPNFEIQLQINGDTFTTQTDTTGDWHIDIPKQIAGTNIEATAISYGVRSDIVTTTVLDCTSPDAPVVNPIESSDVFISGRGEPNGTIRVQLPNGDTLTGNIDAAGYFRLEMPLQLAGTGVRVQVVDASENISTPTNAIIQDAYTSVGSNYAIHALDISLNKSELVNLTQEEINEIIRDRASPQGWDMQAFQAISENQINMTTNATPLSNEGDYTATFTVGDVSHTIKMTLVDDTVLAFATTPDDLNFQTTTIGAELVTIPLEDPNWNLQVKDTRSNNSNWNVTATVNGPFVAENDPQAKKLHDALRYRSGDTSTIIPDNVAFPIYQGKSTGQPIQTIQWEQNQGIQMEVNPVGIKEGQAYQTSVTWSINDTPS